MTEGFTSICTSIVEPRPLQAVFAAAEKDSHLFNPARSSLCATTSFSIFAVSRLCSTLSSPGLSSNELMLGFGGGLSLVFNKPQPRPPKFYCNPHIQAGTGTCLVWTPVVGKPIPVTVTRLAGLNIAKLAKKGVSKKTLVASSIDNGMGFGSAQHES
ncbi:hypothetical protein BDN72DRAFT_860282 [Pluteus cervinus]|uniref:Uncharacterized protein n=1 Tax=Pluteus cervinus TaxID=181527 RepID=A0ACD3AKA8_9AGAR|nr:hypothetical protein BDN72DRAFT_860282 [Pluteus cervinus]